jgi:hypothetical protein
VTTEERDQMNLHTRTCAAAVCFVIVLSALAGGGQLPETARLLPADTLVVASAENFGDLRARFEKTDICKFYKDPAMARFVEDTKGKLLKSFEEDGGFKRFADADYPLPQGRVAIAAIMQPVSPQVKNPKPATVMICQWGKELAKARDLFDKRVKEMEDKGSTLKKEEYRGTQIFSLYRAADAEKKDSQEKPEPSSVSCFIDDSFIFSDRMDTLKFVIAHAAGSTGGALADDADYQAAVKRVGGGDIVVYVNVSKLLAMTMRHSTDPERNTKALGVDKVPCVVAGIKVAPEPGVSLAMKGYIRTSGNKQGVLKILDMASVPMTVPDFIAGDSCSFAMMNLDLAAAWDEAFRMANAVDVRAAAAMNSPIIPPAADGQPGIELKKDIFAYLRPGIWSADVLRKGVDTRTSEIVSLMAAPISDRSKLEKSLARVHERFFGNSAKLRREFLGYTIYSLSFGYGGAEEDEKQNDTMAAETAPAEPAPPAFTVTDKYLLFGDVQVVEDAIHAMKDKTASKLPSAKWYRKAVGSLPSALGSGGVVNMEVYGQYFWKLFKTPEETPSQFTAMADAVRDEIDVTLLPDFGAVKKYFGLGASQFISVPDGFTFEYRMIAAPEE